MKRKRERHNRSNIGIILIILFALAVIALGGWSLFLTPHNTQTSSEQSSPQTSQSISQSEASSQTSSKVTAGFDATKIAKMDNYMSDFSTYMGQNYKRYYPKVQDQTKLNFYGFDITTDLDDFNYYVDNKPATFRLASIKETSYNNSDYNIVGVYSDAETAPFAGAHLYLLTIYNQKPQVLITMQNQGMPGNAMYFKQTENSNLASNFEKIYQG
ncbi:MULTISPECIES: DUF4767 domain-containing protein [Holzapfeliella]